MSSSGDCDLVADEFDLIALRLIVASSFDMLLIYILENSHCLALLPRSYLDLAVAQRAKEKSITNFEQNSQSSKPRIVHSRS